ncbi:MAG: PAS domain S-box protein [Winogradskyella sp.]|uniref:PAS domain-containing sensor histidine kinase n=1 Tax=Winogradskyella sp. TaxID=1883156 RepID=UPI00181D0301|nr:PAS domain S-box protein [Winogradskyella sp.]
MQSLQLKNIDIDQKAQVYDAVNAHHNVAVIDTFERIKDVNEGYCKILGVNKHNIIGETSSILKSRLHSDSLYKNLWGTITNGEVWTGVLPYNVSKSNKYWLQTTVVPVKNKKGTIEKYISFYNDITNYYHQDHLVEELDTCKKAIVKKFPQLVLSLNERGKILRAFNEYRQVEFDEIVGSYIYDYIEQEYHFAVKSKIKEVFNLQTINGFRFASQASEKEKALYFSEIEPVFNNYNEVVFAKVTTERRTEDIKVVSELKAIEAKYSTIFQSINVGIIVVADSNGNISEWNQGAESAFGYSEKEVLGQSLTLLIAEEHMETSIQQLLYLKDHLEDCAQGDTLEMVGVRKNGEKFPVEFAVSSWYCGKDRYFSAIMLDISNRKSLENKLQQKTEDLEQFLYRAAHDLKAPLTTIEGLINLIKHENKQEHISNIIEMLDVSLNRGKLLLDNLSFASVISQKKCQVSSININKEVDKTLQALSSLENFEEIKFCINVNEDIRFYSNKDLFNSMLQNLIQNAIYYCKPLEASHLPTITIDVSQSHQSLDILIKDNGRGISDENLERIFDLYYRVNNEGVQGSALGLYIVKCIVDDLSGHINVESELNIGTTFRIEIPNLK